MSLRTRLTVAGGGAVVVALAIASLVIYLDVRSHLHDQIDLSLTQSAQSTAAKWVDTKDAQAVNARPSSPAGPVLGGSASGYSQLVPSLRLALNQGTPVGTAAPEKTQQLGTLNGFVPLIGR